ncbi:MAG: hypothetical protein WC708_11835 [Lentisphaeria bacterium]
MATALEHLEGRRFCVVFVKVLDLAAGKVQLRCLHGRADVRQGRLDVVTAAGAVFSVPSSAHGSIQASDGTALLRDADYFALVRVDDKMEFVTPDEAETA